MEIPTTELKHGVTLDMIKPEKIIPPLTFQEILDMNAEEEWEQSLEELLDSID